MKATGNLLIKTQNLYERIIILLYLYSDILPYIFTAKELSTAIQIQKQ